MTELIQYLAIGLALGSIYGLIGLGFTIVYNSTGVINFAHGELVMVGGMVAITLVTAGLPLMLAALAAMLVAGIVGVVVEVLTFDRFPRPDPVRVVLATLALGLVIKAAALKIWGKEPYYLDSFSSRQRFRVGGVVIPTQALWVLGITAVLVLATYFFFRNSRHGQAMVATSLDKETAALMGVNVRLMAAGAFMLSGLLGAAAGIVTAPLTASSYSIGPVYSVAGFVAAALGGLGSAPGALLGGAIIGLAETLGAGYVSSELKQTIALGLGLCVLMLRPEGLLKRGNRS
jgi:branched-chain amino acid transport system permease protein